MVSSSFHPPPPHPHGHHYNGGPPPPPLHLLHHHPDAAGFDHSSYSDAIKREQVANYLRNSRSIGVLWAVFTACYAIINVIVFIQPQWLGDTESSKGTGYFGLYKSCRLLQDGQDLICSSNSQNSPFFNSLLPSLPFSPQSSSQSINSISSSSSISPSSSAFKAATLFVGSSVAIIGITLACFPLFFFLHSSTVFHVCGWLQSLNALLMISGLLIFPLGWDDPVIKEVCGSSSDLYSPGDCSLRWAAILAIISTIDICVLAILAFILGTRYVKLLEPKYVKPSQLNGTLMKSSSNQGGFGHVNAAFGTMNHSPPGSESRSFPPLTSLHHHHGHQGGSSQFMVAEDSGSSSSNNQRMKEGKDKNRNKNSSSSAMMMQL